MKNLVIIFFLSLSSYCQDTDILKMQDEIYLLLPYTNNETLTYENFKFRSSGNGVRTEYIFTLPGEKPVYFTTDTKDNKPVVVKRKVFFKDNKNNCIDIEQINSSDTYKLLVEVLTDFKSAGKKIYIIDLAESKKRKFKISRADYVPIGFIEM